MEFTGPAERPAARGSALAVVAHRGASGTHPENTAAAFREAVRLAVECIELDLHLSRDGALVVVHDPTVDRTSDGSGRVSELTLPQIEALDAGSWFGDGFAGEGFLCFEEALDLIPAPIRLNVHIKVEEDTRARVTVAAVDLLRQRRLLDRAYIAADAATLAIARRHCPGLEVCNLSVHPVGDYVARSRALGCRILQPGHAVTDAELVAAAHAHGMRVFPFFADAAEEMERLIRCGVDGILTNFPARLQALLED